MCVGCRHLTTTEEVLRHILPPRKFSDDTGSSWSQSIASTPATKLDVDRLQEQMDITLQESVSETGICLVREEVYSQCFDELIRQVAVNTVERGILVLRCRDQLRMNIATRSAVLESGTAYGMRMSISAEQWMMAKRSQLATVSAQVKAVQAEVKRLHALCDETQASADELSEQRRIAQVRFLFISPYY